jgi:hypothetical protein
LDVRERCSYFAPSFRQRQFIECGCNFSFVGQSTMMSIDQLRQIGKDTPSKEGAGTLVVDPLPVFRLKRATLKICLKVLARLPHVVEQTRPASDLISAKGSGKTRRIRGDIAQVAEK